jgi:hypothetical protein
MERHSLQAVSAVGWEHYTIQPQENSTAGVKVPAIWEGDKQPAPVTAPNCFLYRRWRLRWWLGHLTVVMVPYIPTGGLRRHGRKQQLVSMKCPWV